MQFAGECPHGRVVSGVDVVNMGPKGFRVTKFDELGFRQIERTSTRPLIPLWPDEQAPRRSIAELTATPCSCETCR
jgi:hypothetical protein